MKLYDTVWREASAEQTIERSRFIAHVRPVGSREEAEAFIARIRKEHKDATHNVPAMVIGDKMQLQWASDDGEPQGTAGAPVVQLLTSAGITNTVIVVTRYFGGIKLGTGGLVRAYTSSAKLGLEAAGTCSVEQRLCLSVGLDYSHLARLRKLAGDDFEILDLSYGEKIQAELSCQPENRARLESLLADLTAGRYDVLHEEIRAVRHLIKING